MERWCGKVAVVTGASSGIGAATVKALSTAGLTTIGLARRVDRVEALKSALPNEVASRVHAIRCDITSEQDIVRAFAEVCQRFGGVDVLINNAGISRDPAVLDAGNGPAVREIFDTNVAGLIHCSREAFQSMKSRGVEGHIVNINSVTGHRVMDLPRLSIYCGSKFAVTALSESMRHQLRKEEGANVKVTSISPGLTKTEMLDGLPNVDQFPMLQPEDIADAIRYVLSTPPHVQIGELTVRPTGEVF